MDLFFTSRQFYALLVEAPRQTRSSLKQKALKRKTRDKKHQTSNIIPKDQKVVLFFAIAKGQKKPKRQRLKKNVIRIAKFQTKRRRNIKKKGLSLSQKDPRPRKTRPFDIQKKIHFIRTNLAQSFFTVSKKYRNILDFAFH